MISMPVLWRCRSMKKIPDGISVLHYYFDITAFKRHKIRAQLTTIEIEPANFASDPLINDIIIKTAISVILNLDSVEFPRQVR